VSSQKGWGVFAEDTIPAGTFVTEYIGELLNSTETAQRERYYERYKLQSYLFELDFFEQAVLDAGLEIDTFSIDAFRYGNVSRFLNHRYCSACLCFND
jgi:SET domain-containing protein